MFGGAASLWFSTKELHSPDAKTSMIWGNFCIVGVRLKPLSCSCFCSTFSVMNLTEIMFIKFVNNIELVETAGMIQGRISLQNDLDKLRSRLK